MIDLRFKLNRINTLSTLAGSMQALRFELEWSLRLQEARLRLPGYPAAFGIRRRDSDLNVFWTIFVQNELSAHSLEKPRLIIDGGANIGFSTAWLAKHYPSATVAAIEPSGENCTLLKRHCAGFDNIRLFHGGLWSSAGFLCIENPDDPSWALRCKPTDATETGAFRAFTIAEIIDLCGRERCDLLKLDIEGAEADLFEPEAATWLDRVDAMLIEVHSEKAMANVKARCPESLFAYSVSGEKILLVRKDISCAPQAFCAS